MKVCSICGVEKPLDAFHVKREARDGRDGRCIDCHRTRMRTLKAARAEHWNARERDRYRAAPEAFLQKTRAYRATERGKEVNRQIRRGQRLRHPEKERARLALKHELRMGRMARPAACEACGANCKPHGHHDDYSKPLDVRWLCTACHAAAHHGPATPAAQRHTEA